MTNVMFTGASIRWLEVLLSERFGHKVQLSHDADKLLLTLPGSERSICFDYLQSIFHEACSDFTCMHWVASREDYDAPINDLIPAPSCIELPLPLIELHDSGATIHYDILGLTYWMLTRLEEVNCNELDNHQRFSAFTSHAYRNGYLERPVVDEWLDILKQVMQRVWPELGVKIHEFRTLVSHDVDSPSLYAFKPWPVIGRMMAGHLIKRRDVKAFLTAPYIKLATKTKLHSADPFNTFDWLMDVSEANSLTSTFYFICGHHDQLYDADYEPENLIIRNLMLRIHERGHEIGLHPSYETFQNPELIKQEAARLKHVCSLEGLEQSSWGARMHYLRWQHPTTLRALDAAGLSYDASLGYADRPGFRCGTSHEYPAFDPLTQEQLKLRIKPLVVMECSVIEKIYLGLGVGQQAVDKINFLKERTRQVSGQFTLLWHNSYLHSEKLKAMYRDCVRASEALN